MITAGSIGADWAEVSVRLIVCIIGVLGNLLVIFVIVALKEYKKAVTHWYVLQLAIADTIFLLTVPFKVDEEIRRGWNFSAGMCKGKETILFLNYYASILFLVVMSIDRYIAVCHAFSDSLQKLRKHSSAFIITAVIWVIALLFCIPVMVYSGKSGNMPNCTCSYDFPIPAKTPVAYCLEEKFKPGQPLWNYCLCTKNDSINKPKPRCIPVAKVPVTIPLKCISLIGGGGLLPLPKPTIASNTTKTPTINVSVTTSLSSTATTTTIATTTTSALKTNTATGTTTSTTTAKPVGIPSGCQYHHTGPGWKAFLIFNFTIMFILPLGIMTFCYLMIILKLRESRVHFVRNTTNDVSQSTSSAIDISRRQKSAAESHADAERNRVTVTCAVLVTVFLICWLPYHSVHMSKIVGMALGIQNKRWCSIFTLAASLMAYMNSALNPYLYNFLGTRFAVRIRRAAIGVSYSVKQRSVTDTTKEEKKTAETTQNTTTALK